MASYERIAWEIGRLPVVATGSRFKSILLDPNVCGNTGLDSRRY